MLADKFETFKEELTNILNVIIAGHNEMKQELFIMRHHEKTIDEKISKTENAINVLTTKMDGRFIETEIKATKQNLPKSTSNPTVPSVKLPVRETVIKTSRHEEKQSLSDVTLADAEDQRFKAHKVILPRGKSSPRSILMIGDSIAGNIHLPSIESATKADVN